jgi:serine protease Do
MHKRLLAGLVAAAMIPGLLAAADAPKDGAKAPAKAYLGVMLEPTAKDAPQAGAVVREVAPDSPALKAGLKTGDVIVKVGDSAIKDAKAVVDAVTGSKPGANLVLHVMRDGKEQNFQVTLGERRVVRIERFPQWREFSGAKTPWLGAAVQELTPELKEKLGVTVDHGLVVGDVAPNSPAAKAGLKKDDVITAVGDAQVKSYAELRGAIDKLGAGKETTLKVARGKEAVELKTTIGAMPLGFGMRPGFDEEFWKDLPEGFGPEELRRRFEELHQRFRELEQKQQEQPTN